MYPTFVFDLRNFHCKPILSCSIKTYFFRSCIYQTNFFNKIKNSYLRNFKHAEIFTVDVLMHAQRLAYNFDALARLFKVSLILKTGSQAFKKVAQKCFWIVFLYFVKKKWIILSKSKTHRRLFSWIFLIYVHGNLLRILCRSNIQNPSWPKLEKCRPLYWSSLPWSYFWNLLYFEFFHLGSKIFRCGSIYNHDCHFMHVDGSFVTTSFLRILFWCKKTTIWSTSTDQSDSTTDSGPTLVYEYSCVVINGWGVALWSSFYWIVFHFYSNLGKWILLPFWIFILGICDSYSEGL